MSKTPELSLDQQVKMLTGQVVFLRQQVEHMQKLGGFTDAKTLSIRSTRLESRMEAVEKSVNLLRHDADMLMDVSAAVVSFAADHLVDRHQARLVVDNQLDVHAVSKMKRRMRQWAEDRGLFTKRNDMRDARRSERRRRPAPAVPDMVPAV